MNKKYCKTCDFWDEMWLRCKHPFKSVCETKAGTVLPHNVCKLYRAVRYEKQTKINKK